MIRRSLLLALFLLCTVFAALPAFAAESAASKPPVDKPAAQADRTTAIAVEHEGTDPVGAKLAFQLKNLFNTSSLFTLTEKDGPKIKIYLTSAPEFAGRPGIASAYSVIWAFSQAEGTLSFLLAREVGVVAAEDVDGLVAKLAEKTDGVAVKYKYLFNK